MSNMPSAVTPAQPTSAMPAVTAKPSPLHRTGSTSPATGSSEAASKPNAEQNVYENHEGIVLNYLKDRGMNQAFIDLKEELDLKHVKSKKAKTPRQRLNEEEDKMRAQRTLLAKTTGGGYGYDRDSAWPAVQWGFPNTTAAPVRRSDSERASAPKYCALGVEEARALVDSFVHFQLWFLNLPDGPDREGKQYDNIQIQFQSESAILRGRQLINQGRQKADLTVAKLVQTMIDKPKAPHVQETKVVQRSVYNLPPSVKYELLAVSFAFFVHVYVDLLEYGMESTAKAVREAFAPVYRDVFQEEFRDCCQCTTTEDILRLNSHNSQHMEAVGNLKTLLVQVASYQLRKDEYIAQMQSNMVEPKTAEELVNDPKVKECDKKIHILQTKYKEMSQRASQWFEKMHDLPFLRRARATRWIITLSTSSYSMLSDFLGSHGDSLVPMATLLQIKCTIQVESRDPLPYTPACVFANLNPQVEKRGLSLRSSNWTFPAPRPEEKTSKDRGGKRELPSTEIFSEQGEKERIINAFRRLEELERKRDAEVLSPSCRKRIRHYGGSAKRELSDPVRPSILMSSFSSSTRSQAVKGGRKGLAALSNKSAVTSSMASMWEEPGVEECCAKTCRLGRRVAIGCDDSSIRIHSFENNGSDLCNVLWGHRNGCPVFDVEWNEDGRSLLSCGGDGAIRLWDTMKSTPSDGPGASGKGNAKINSRKPPKDSDGYVSVPGSQALESVAQTHGAAVAVYKGHAPNTPVWSVSFAPCGYYFCSVGSDFSARLWTTDRPLPIRLFSGHTSANVNTVGWHPNANYVVTGSDDKTARLWDIQTGSSVRILSGCNSGIGKVRISPDGRHCAGADYTGVVHLWDLGSGKKISTFRQPAPAKRERSLHALSFSACGGALAAGGDDFCVRIWDLKNLQNNSSEKELKKSPALSIATKHSIVMDLHYSSRNLLLAVGKRLNN